MTYGTIVRPVDARTFLYAGQPMAVLAEPAPGVDSLAAAEMLVPPLFAGPVPHAHNGFDEALYVLDGVLLLTYGQAEPVEASAGTFCMAPHAQQVVRPFQVLRQQDVVVGRPAEEAPPRDPGDLVVVGVRADVLRLSQVANPRVLLGEAATELLRAIGGGIVRDHQLEVTERLRQMRLDRRPEEVSAVVHRNPDADLRYPGFRHRSVSVCRSSACRAPGPRPGVHIGARPRVDQGLPPASHPPGRAEPPGTRHLKRANHTLT